MTEPTKPVPSHPHATIPENDAAVIVDEKSIAAEKKAQKDRADHEFKISR